MKKLFLCLALLCILCFPVIAEDLTKTGAFEYELDDPNYNPDGTINQNVLAGRKLGKILYYMQLTQVESGNILLYSFDRPQIDSSTVVLTVSGDQSLTEEGEYDLVIRIVNKLGNGQEFEAPKQDLKVRRLVFDIPEPTPTPVPPTPTPVPPTPTPEPTQTPEPFQPLPVDNLKFRPIENETDFQETSFGGGTSKVRAYDLLKSKGLRSIQDGEVRNKILH